MGALNKETEEETLACSVEKSIQRLREKLTAKSKCERMA
jgi:hypothetical protein